MSFRYPVVMPKMSMTMETGELIDYHVKVGDRVNSGDVLFEVMTDKIDMEVESPADGVVEQLIGEVGATIEIGKPVLILLTDTEVMAFDFGGEATPLPPAPASIEVEQVVEEVVVVPEVIAPIAVAPTIVSQTFKAVPKARAFATESGIDLRTIVASGPDQTIMYADVANQRPSEEQLKRQAANRALIARGIEMTQNIPQASFTRSINISDPGMPHLISSWAKVLRSRPELNVSGKDGVLNQLVGVATIIESKYGSALPVYKNPDLMGKDELSALVSTTSSAAQHGKVPLSMLSGATTTVFDLRSYKMITTTPRLFPHQVTGLTIGESLDGSIALSLTIDLRHCDFYDGANLLELLVKTL